jgi:hypothetical protein
MKRWQKVYNIGSVLLLLRSRGTLLCCLLFHLLFRLAKPLSGTVHSDAVYHEPHAIEHKPNHKHSEGGADSKVVHLQATRSRAQEDSNQ